MPPSLPILKRLWPGRIRSQLICGVVLVELVFMMLFVGAMVARQQKFLRQQNLEETQMQAATLAVNSLSWILANDVAGLEEILRSQRDHPRLRYAMILSPEGKVLAHTESARLGMYVNDATSRAFLKSAPKMQTLHADRSLLDIAAPIQTRGGEMVGWVRIGHDQHWITDHLHRVVRNGVLYTLLAILAGSILAILLGNRLTRGLDKLLSLSAQIRDGRRDVRMEISGADEISRLGGGLNQMLEAMKESEKLARVLVDRAPEAILVFDTELNHFVDANPNAEQLFGYSREELLALSPIQLYTPDQPQNRPVQEMIAEITERVLTGEEVVCERHIHNAEGRRFVCELRLVRLPPESRKLIRCSYLDITERKRIEEELRENRERLEFAIESGGMGTWDWHPQSGKVLYGKLWLQMLEYAPDEVDSNFAFFLQHLHPDDRPDVLQRLVDHIEGRVPAFKSEHRLHTKSGKWKWVLDSGKVVEWDKEGHATRATGIIVDITERKGGEEALEKRLISLTGPADSTAGLRFEDLFNLEEIQKIQDAFSAATGVASIITDTNGRPITQPSNFCRLCKSIRGTEKGLLNCYRSDAALGRMNPTGPIVQPCLSGGLLDGGASIRAGEEHIANWLIGQVRDESISDETIVAYARKIGLDEKAFQKDLDEVPHMAKERFERIAHALFLIAGQLSHLALQNIQQARNITERKRAAESLQQAKETAEAANRAKDQFIAVLSHELRTPLTPVLATVVNLQKETHLPADLRTDMEVIQRNVELEAQLIDDLLDVTRISQGKINLRLETVDVHACLQRTLEICREEIDSKRLDVPLEFAAAQPYVQADMARLQQVFWNLLKNAIKFTPEGGCIRIRSSNVGGQIQIEIADTGIGIEPELMPRIFNAFEQGEQTKTRRFGGLGLGLSIAKAVMDLHHGALTCASEGKDKGATFTVTLATVAAPTAAPAQPPPPPAAAQEEKHWKILLVEDHPDTLRILFRLLNKWGYAITSADSVHAALEAAGKERFDLLVSDLGLPDGSGLDIMRQMKSSYGIPGIALSGYGTENDLRQSREAGFEEHLIKPVDIETLRTALQKITVHLS